MNLSGASLNDESFLQDAVQLLQRYADVAPRLCLEITEAWPCDLETSASSPRCMAWGPRWRSMILARATPRFPTSSSSRRPAQDRRQLHRQHERAPGQSGHRRAIVGLARNLGMKTIAEWAEDNATVQALAEIGVDYVQGLCRCPLASAERILAARSAADFVSDRACCIPWCCRPGPRHSRPRACHRVGRH